jgi:perosamine synthetase
MKSATQHSFTSDQAAVKHGRERLIPFGKPLLGSEEKHAVAQTLEGDVLVHGPRAAAFETDFARFVRAPYAVSVSNCTAALHLCYFHLGVGPGDEVIVPAQTHNATAHAVELTGAKPVFVDSESETGNIDIDQIEGQITSRTKAISVVHYLGMPVRMDAVNLIARKHGLSVIEDCALSLGARYKEVHTGLHGDAGCFSFYPVKHMTTGEGGMLITRHEEWAQKIQRKKAFGVDRTAGERSMPGVYDVTMLGFNYRMSEIHAALGVGQLRRMPHFLTKRRQNYEALSEGLRELAEIDLLRSTYGEFESSYYCQSILLKNGLTSKRFEIVSQLKSRGIGTSIYYPRPVPHFTYYKNKYGYSEKSYPVAARLSYDSIALPVGPHLNPEDMVYITETLKAIIAKMT